VARMFQAQCAWLISMVATRLEARTEWCDKIRVLSAIIEQFIAFYRDERPVITHFIAYYRSDQAELGTKVGNGVLECWGDVKSYGLLRESADCYAMFHEVTRKFAQNRPVNPRCYALLRV
jgi:hypothetical protein